MLKPIQHDRNNRPPLFNSVEAHAPALGEPRPWVHASLMAQPAFAATGLSVVEHQVVQIGDQDFKRALMEKGVVASAFIPPVKCKTSLSPTHRTSITAYRLYGPAIT